MSISNSNIETEEKTELQQPTLRRSARLNDRNEESATDSNENATLIARLAALEARESRRSHRSLWRTGLMDPAKQRDVDEEESRSDERLKDYREQQRNSIEFL